MEKIESIFNEERNSFLLSQQITFNRLKEVDDFLEKILIEEGDKKVLKKFNEEMKGVWKKDFERYRKGLMDPLERTFFW